jgi:hypothetical protein
MPIQSSNRPDAKTNPGARPNTTKDSKASPLAGSVLQRDWVISDREYKESLNR